MKVATFEQQLQTIITVAWTLVHVDLNHDRRNERLKALQAVIDNYIQNTERWGLMDDDTQYRLTVLRTCYEMAIWRLEHETHSCVKTRLRLMVEVCENALGVMQRKEEASRPWATAKVEPFNPPPQDMDDIPFE